MTQGGVTSSGNSMCQVKARERVRAEQVELNFRPICAFPSSDGSREWGAGPSVLP